MVGVESLDLFGTDIRIFIDASGLVADCPALSSVIDLKSHYADTTCPLCTIPRRKDIMGSVYGYTTVIASGGTSNVPSAQRSEEIQNFCCVNRSRAKSLGIQERAMAAPKISPPFKLHKKL